MSKSEYELARRLLVIDRGASEAEDARAVPPSHDTPILTDDQCAAVDECSDFAAGLAA